MDNAAALPGLAGSGDKLALVFPGQGSQHIGMGKQLYERFASARAVFQQADDLLGMALSKISFEGPADVLDDTVNAQPAIFTVSIAALEVLKERYQALGQKLTPVAVAGHSLGEYSALVAAGALDFSDGLRLVQERGRLMKEAGVERPGGMAAVLGLDREALSALCLEISQEGGIVVLANDNCPGQSVISGELQALERAMSLAVRDGARKAIRLGITIASHSPLMERAGQQLSLLVDKAHFHEPGVPIVSNITGKVSTSVDELRRNLSEHVVRPVMWTNSVGSMVDNGATTFIELGPGNVLSGLIRRIKRDARTFTLGDLVPLTTNS